MAQFKTQISEVLPVLFTALFVVLMSCNLATAAGWENSRELAMRLKEANRNAEAYQAAAAFTSGSDTDMFDREFVCGWIALRNLNRPDVALEHFKKMAGHISGLRGDLQGVSKAKAGYWIGRALKAAGRQTDADRLFKASMAFSTTFYGQLSASELKTTVDKARIPKSMIGSYPIKSFYWQDQRVPKELLHALIREESRFNQNANSNKAARGMMQVLDGTAKHVGRQVGVNVDVSMMRKSTDYNVAIGSRYLGDLLQQYQGGTVLALAGYNAGPQRADEWLARFGDPRGGRVDAVDWVENIPFRETREYVQKVMGSYIVYRAITQNR
jgi:soluble lytic murein transglycosylase-like protein